MFNSKLLTSSEVGVRLRRSRGWVQENHKRLGLVSVKLGRQYLFPSEALELWIQNHETSKQEKVSPEAKSTAKDKIRIVPRAS